MFVDTEAYTEYGAYIAESSTEEVQHSDDSRPNGSTLAIKPSFSAARRRNVMTLATMRESRISVSSSYIVLAVLVESDVLHYKVLEVSRRNRRCGDEGRLTSSVREYICNEPRGIKVTTRWNRKKPC